MADTLRWVWTSHRGRSWDLTNGLGDVVMANDLAGLQWNNFSHIWSDTNQLHRGVKEQNLELDLKLDIGWRHTGIRRYQVRRDWWKSSSPYHWGTLRCIHPDGRFREAKFRLRESPQTVFQADPGAGISEDSIEVWPLISDSPWWYGPEISIKKPAMSTAALTPEVTPIFGVDGDAWPVHTSADLPDGVTSVGSGSSAYYVIENQGDAPLYMTYDLSGQYSGLEFGLIDIQTGRAYSNMFNRALQPIESATLVANRTNPKLTSANGRVKWAELTKADFLSIAPGTRYKLAAQPPFGAPSTKTAWNITVRFRQSYAMPF